MNGMKKQCFLQLTLTDSLPLGQEEKKEEEFDLRFFSVRFKKRPVDAESHGYLMNSIEVLIFLKMGWFLGQTKKI